MNEKPQKQWGTPQMVLTAVVLLLVLAMIVGFILWQINEFTLELTLNGPTEITLEYGELYEDPGAGAVFHGTLFFKEPLDVTVIQEGYVDYETLGTYQIRYLSTYTVDSMFGEVVLAADAIRTIRVVDTVAPVITLTTNPDTFTIPGETYQEEGFSATDNYDGDITDLVVRTETTEAITYQVSDSSGNAVTVDRPIVYHDPIPPELVLNGEASMMLERGKTYQEPGFTATDNCDGDLTQQVTVTGTVDTMKEGTYTLTYTVQDSYENVTTVTRTVTVYAPDATRPTEPKDPEKETTTISGQKANPKNPVGGVIYLTFDDGPSRYTSRLLDILAKYDAKATFFVVNTGYISTVSRMAAEGHAVAMHSATHDFQKIYASEEAFFADLEKIQSLITTYTGKTSMLMRFPGGSSNSVSRFNKGIMTRLAALVQERGYTYFDWNVDSNDAGGATTALEVYNNVVNGVATRKSSVVLLHDIKGYTVDAIEEIIIWGLANGYTFQALTPDSPTCHHGIRN